jgi:hypothetical protein
MRSCFLLLLLLGSSLAAQQRFPADYQDDIYHCRDPSGVDENKSLACSETTYLWQVDLLEADRPPKICGGGPNFQMNPDDIPQLADEEEPCLLWALTYGNLAPSAPPSKDSNSFCK